MTALLRRFAASSPVWKGIAIVAAGQVLALAWIVAGHVHHLTTGREIVLDVVPVDPRSLFRGDYVVLSTAAHALPRAMLDRQPFDGGDVFVVLEPEAGKGWRTVSASAKPPATTSVRANQVVLKGRVIEQPVGERPVRVRYGIETYFVPEGKGRQLERAIGTKRVSVKLAVTSDGRAAIKSLLVDGEPVYSDSLL
jgi:uncharacterized membrane-anchored protein